MLNLREQRSAGAVKRHLIAHDSGFERIRFGIFCPDSFSALEDLDSHDGGGCAEVQKVDFDADRISEFVRELESCFRWCVPCHEHGDVEVGLWVRSTLDSAAEEVDAQDIVEGGLERVDDLVFVHFM